MGLFSKDIGTMDDLFVDRLRNIYYAEQEILNALPALIEKVTNPQLRLALEQHHAETFKHYRRVEQVFEIHGIPLQTINSPANDAALIAAAQAVEHYEVARYGTLASWAKQLGHSDCAGVLQRNLEEESGGRKAYANRGIQSQS